VKLLLYRNDLLDDLGVYSPWSLLQAGNDIHVVQWNGEWPIPMRRRAPPRRIGPAHFAHFSVFWYSDFSFPPYFYFLFLLFFVFSFYSFFTFEFYFCFLFLFLVFLFLKRFRILKFVHDFKKLSCFF
jgi:hypothetical protein